MRALILLHRWLGAAFCLLCAMGFASGIIMHKRRLTGKLHASRRAYRWLFAGLWPARQ
jgi:hypothetical protein